MSQQNKEQRRNSKKAKKSETEGNVLIFYALQCAASSVLKSKVTATKISFKSAVKAQVQYACVLEDGITKDQQKQIELEVNNMLKSSTKVSCSERSDKDCILPSGIDGDSQLYDITINDNLAVSHIPVSVDNLGSLLNLAPLNEMSECIDDRHIEWIQNDQMQLHEKQKYFGSFLFIQSKQSK